MTLELDNYERDNLIALLELVYKGEVGPLDTGDWCGQLLWKLTEGKGFDPEIHSPNIPLRIQQKLVEAYWFQKLVVK